MTLNLNSLVFINTRLYWCRQSYRLLKVFSRCWWIQPRSSQYFSSTVDLWLV